MSRSGIDHPTALACVPPPQVPREAEDVAEERRRVEALGAAADSSNAVVVHDLAKTFPASRGAR